MLELIEGLIFTIISHAIVLVIRQFCVRSERLSIGDVVVDIFLLNPATFNVFLPVRRPYSKADVASLGCAVVSEDLKTAGCERFKSLKEKVVRQR